MAIGAIGPVVVLPIQVYEITKREQLNLDNDVLPSNLDFPPLNLDDSLLEEPRDLGLDEDGGVVIC